MAGWEINSLSKSEKFWIKEQYLSHHWTYFILGYLMIENYGQSYTDLILRYFTLLDFSGASDGLVKWLHLV